MPGYLCIIITIPNKKFVWLFVVKVIIINVTFTGSILVNLGKMSSSLDPSFSFWCNAELSVSLFEINQEANNIEMSRTRNEATPTQCSETCLRNIFSILEKFYAIRSLSIDRLTMDLTTCRIRNKFFLFVEFTVWFVNSNTDTQIRMGYCIEIIKMEITWSLREFKKFTEENRCSKLSNLWCSLNHC